MSKLFAHQLIGGLGAAGVDTDPYFASTTLLLKGDGNQGATNFSNAGPPTYLAFKDNSTNNFPITVNGDAYGDNFGPFAIADGYWSNSFDGSGDYIQAGSNAALAPGSGDFTIECWIYPTNNNFYNGIYQNYTDGLSRSTALRINTNNADQTSLMVQTAATALITTSTGVVTANAWNHIALVRNGAGSNNLVLYVNGVSAGSATNTTNFSDGYAQIGNSVYNGTNYYWNGGISNLRVVPGIAVYTGNFSVPTSPLSTTQSSDTNIAAITGTSTSLLTCQSNRFLDNSTNNFTITPAGNVATKVFNPFTELPSGYWSNSFDGNGDYLTGPSDAAFGFGTSNFTIECWYRKTANGVNGYDGLISTSTDGNGSGGYYIELSATRGFFFRIGSSNYTETTTTWINDGNWHHFAVARDGSTLRYFIDGAVKATFTSFSETLLQSNLRIGAVPNASNVPTYFFNGSISNLRVTKGIAVYTGAFTPPTSPLEKTQSSGTNIAAITNSEVGLLTCQDGAFLDRSDNSFAITAYGNAATSRNSPFTKPAIPAAALPDGVNGSGYFDGTGDYISVVDGSWITLGTNNFTAEAWIYNTVSTGAGQYICGQGASSGTASTVSFEMYLNSSRNLVGGIYVGSQKYATSSGTIPLNTWTHVALVRDGGNVRLYINGVQDGLNSTAGTSSVTDQSYNFSIGRPGEYNGLYFNGMVSNFRFVNGTCVYPDGTTFTPPSSPLTAVTNTKLLTTQYAGTVRNVGFIDSGPYDFPITRVGNTTQGSFSPFSKSDGRWGNYFDGTNSYLTSASDASAFVLGSSGDFTIECWVYPSGSQGLYAGVLMSYASWSQFSGRFALAINGTTLAWLGSTGNIDISTTITTDTFSHVAVVRSGSTITMYLNGTSVGTTTSNQAFTTTPAAITLGLANTYFKGYISNARVVKGTAVYTGAFTPSTTPLTAITNTSLLTCQSNRFKDNSTNNFAITAAGNVAVTPFSPFPITTAYSPAVNGGSGYFDANNGYLTIPYSSSVEFGSQDWTVEMWIYVDSTHWASSPAPIINYKSDTNSHYGASFGTNNPGYASLALSTTGSSWAVVATSTDRMYGDTWNHVAFVRSGANIYIYTNGNRYTASTTYSGNVYVVPNVPIIIGRGGTGGNYQYQFKGSMSGLRVIHGTALYTDATVAVPTTPPTSISGTNILCNYTNAGIYDSTAFNNLQTVGNAQVDTTTKKYGTGAMKFDGTGDNLTIASNPSVWFGSGAFTIEMWLYPNDASSEQMLVAGSDTGSLFLGMNIDGANRIALGRKGVAVDNQVSYTYTTSAWIHLACTRDTSNNIRFFVDGTQVGSTGSNSISFTNSVLNIGFEPTQKYFNGYIDDLRITKGVARYTDTFDPPIKTLPIVGV